MYVEYVRRDSSASGHSVATTCRNPASWNVELKHASSTPTVASAVVTGSWAWVRHRPRQRVEAGGARGSRGRVTGSVRSRSAITDFSSLTEAALNLHGRALATELGVADENRAGVLTPAEGKQITAIVRKGR